MGTYRIGNETYTSDSTELAAALAAAHAARQRPLCGCRAVGVEMYIARIGERYVVKRMPNTGERHEPSCEHYEPPAELSGLGEVAGSAIVVDPGGGPTTIKFDFALSKSGATKSREPSGEPGDSVATQGKKLTLRGTLHYLWDEAGFTRWSPAMEGRRNWFVIRKYLLQAVEGKVSKGASLQDLLFVPEPFHQEHKADIEARRIAAMTRASWAGSASTRELMMMIAEVKEMAPSRYGHKLIFKHLPGVPFMMNDDMHRRLMKRFENDIELWNAFDDAHLIAIGTFGMSATGVATLQELAVMCVTANWIPFESTQDLLLIDKMTEANRRFVKCLRYNLAATRPLACLVATDTQPVPTAMHILRPGAREDYVNATRALMAESSLSHWLWKSGEGAMPPLPNVTGRPAQVTRSMPGHDERQVDLQQGSDGPTSPALSIDPETGELL